jgi:hypothetical protein
MLDMMLSNGLAVKSSFAADSTGDRPSIAGLNECGTIVIQLAPPPACRQFPSMNDDASPEALEVRIAPASLIDAVAGDPVGEAAPLQEATGGTPPFFGPISADSSADLAPVSDLPANGFSIAEGRTITDVAPASISPAFAVNDLGGLVASLDPTLGLTSLLAEKAGAALTPSGILNDGATGNSGSADVLGLGQQVGVESLTNGAGLSAPVLLVDVPTLESSL